MAVSTISNGVRPITFGDSSKTLLANLQDSWQTIVPNDTKLHFTVITAQYGQCFGYISRYGSNGSGLVTRYDGRVYALFLSSGTVTVKNVTTS